MHLTPHQLRRAYEKQATYPDRFIADLARSRLKMLPEGPEPPIEEDEYL
jgi:hypothetical protein